MLAIAFSAGSVLPLVGKALLRPDHRNVLWRFLSFLRSTAGYIACFGAGVLLTSVMMTKLFPYKVAAWFSVYDDAVVGSLVMDSDDIRTAGQNPQAVLD